MLYTKRIGAVLDRLRIQIDSNRTELNDIWFQECGYKTDNHPPAPPTEENTNGWKNFTSKDQWAGVRDTHGWFLVRLPQNVEYEGKRVEISPFPIDEQGNEMNAQFIAYVGEQMICGLDLYHTRLEVDYHEGLEIYFYAYTGMCFENTMKFLCWAILADKESRALYYDMCVPYDILCYLQEDTKEYIDIYQFLNNAINRIDFREPGSNSFLESVKAAREYLQEEFYGDYCKQQQITTVCIGHTHIDVAWLWTMKQTAEKVQRTFSTVLMLMRKYPEFKFMSSQPQLYEFFIKEAPTELVEEMRQRIAEGRWEVEGAMWVEADCNLISGESMIRQLLFGKRYFKEQFGVENKILWLPDVFGYSAAMPQILRKSGVDTFVTSKISWNDTNMMPHDTFMWKGIDGSEVFSYFLTAQDKVKGQPITNYTTYLGMPEPRQIQGTWERFHDKELTDEVINTFGYGDGGGGPTAEQIEKIRRMAKGIPGCANAKIDTATSFIEKLKQNALEDKRLAKWTGDLYLEFHRGTYTSIAKNKRYNRKGEYLMADAEWMSTMALLLNSEAYPKKTLHENWKRLLVNQFHDVLPGSSIKDVYEESDQSYSIFFSEMSKLYDQQKESIKANISTNGGLLVFNPHSFVASAEVEVDGQYYTLQDIPPKGYCVVSPRTIKGELRIEDYFIENDYIKVLFNKNYEIVSLYDKREGRELLQPETIGNRLIAFDDNYNYEFDAWEIKPYYTEKFWVIDQVEGVEKIEEGARVGFCVKRKFLDSIITQKILLYEGSSRVEFENDVDWRQHHILLKTEFPVDINADKAVYDIQFGNIERNTHRNTSWDAAKFEVCAHRYADLSENGYGVALLNDCKYGYDIEDGIMRLTLLKSATYPNEDADIGQHYFRYAIYPHQGNFYCSDVTRAAALFNNPLQAEWISQQQGNLPERYTLVSCNQNNITISAIKEGEDGGIILRAYEECNKRTEAEITFAVPIKRAILCDMMENELSEINCVNSIIRIKFRPYEIHTIKIITEDGYL